MRAEKPSDNDSESEDKQGLDDSGLELKTVQNDENKINTQKREIKDIEI